MGYPTDKNGESCSAFHTGKEDSSPSPSIDKGHDHRHFKCSHKSCPGHATNQGRCGVLDTPAGLVGFTCSNKRCRGHTSKFAVCHEYDKCHAERMGETHLPALIIDPPNMFSEVSQLKEPTPDRAAFTLADLPPPDAASFLKGALAEMAARAEVRDQPGGERAMARTVAIFNAIRGDSVVGSNSQAETINQGSKGIVSELDGWLFMIALKLARSMRGKFNADDYTDLAAYAALAGECAAKAG